MIVIAALVAIAMVVWTDDSDNAVLLMVAALILEGCTR